MRWFKHFSDASDDEYLVEVEELFGLEGYARYFKILEVIAKNMDSKGNCSVALSWTKWQAILKGKRNKLETFLKHSENKSKMNLKQTGNILEISCPKLLNMRDNYSKDLQVNKKNLPSIEVEVEVEEYITNKDIINTDIYKLTKRETRAQKISLDDLSINHIADWLIEKNIPQEFAQIKLEDLRDYCKSKNKRYSDYLAAWRNFIRKDFNNQPKGQQNGKLHKTTTNTRAIGNARQDAETYITESGAMLDPNNPLHAMRINIDKQRKTKIPAIESRQ